MRGGRDARRRVEVPIMRWPRALIRQDQGVLRISKRVLRGIVHRESLAVDGVLELGGASVWKRLFKWLGLSSEPRGIYLELGDGEVAIEVTIVARSGMPIPQIAAALRERLTAAVREQTGLIVRTVNVVVASVHAVAEPAPRREEAPPAGRDAPIEAPPPKAPPTRPRFDVGDGGRR